MTKQTAQTEREFIEYRFNEVFKRLDRMEHTMNGFAFAKQANLDALAKELRDDYVKKEDLKWVKNVVAGISVGVGVALAIAVIKLVGASI